MLKIRRELVEGVKNATSVEDLYPYLQGAIELEHSTIPPYLTAMYSLKDGNSQIKGILRGVVMEEMLHMTIAANILIALGGSPKIYDPAFIPTYPGHLPMNVENSLVVGLESFSLNLVKNTFMEIEQPEKIPNFPVRLLMRIEDVTTIGQFYEALKSKIAELAPEGPLGRDANQVIAGFAPSELFTIANKADAARAIDIIVEQGEGTTQNPLNDHQHLAHYYLFASIANGRMLIADPTVPDLGYSYSGAPITFDTTAVFPLTPNMKISDLPADGPEIALAQDFSKTYSQLLKQLDVAFNRDPTKIFDAIDTMSDLSDKALALVQTPFPGDPSRTLGLPFEYVAVP